MKKSKYYKTSQYGKSGRVLTKLFSITGVAGVVSTTVAVPLVLVKNKDEDPWTKLQINENFISKMFSYNNDQYGKVEVNFLPKNTQQFTFELQEPKQFPLKNRFKKVVKVISTHADGRKRIFNINIEGAKSEFEWEWSDIKGTQYEQIYAKAGFDFQQEYDSLWNDANHSFDEKIVGIIPDGFPIPREVTSISTNAFKVANIQGSIVWPNTITNFNGDGVFENATFQDPNKFSLPSDTTIIRNRTFKNAKTSNRQPFGKNLFKNSQIIEIGVEAFANTNPSTNIADPFIDFVIPKSINKIGAMAFANRGIGNHFKFADLDKPMTWGEKVFASSWIHQGLEIPNQVTLDTNATWDTMFDQVRLYETGQRVSWTSGLNPTSGAKANDPWIEVNQSYIESLFTITDLYGKVKVTFNQPTNKQLFTFDWKNEADSNYVTKDQTNNVEAIVFVEYNDGTQKLSQEFKIPIRKPSSNFEFEWSDITDPNSKYYKYFDIYKKAGFTGNETALLKDQSHSFSFQTVGIIPDGFPVPREITDIGDQTFSDAKIEGTIIWSKNISNFSGTGTFKNAIFEAADKFKLPQNLTEINDSLFENVTSSNDKAFSYQLFNGLRLTKIGARAFASNTAPSLSTKPLVDFVIPNTVSSIGTEAFKNVGLGKRFGFNRNSSLTLASQVFANTYLFYGLSIPKNAQLDTTNGADWDTMFDNAKSYDDDAVVTWSSTSGKPDAGAIAQKEFLELYTIDEDIVKTMIRVKDQYGKNYLSYSPITKQYFSFNIKSAPQNFDQTLNKWTKYAGASAAQETHLDAYGGNNPNNLEFTIEVLYDDGKNRGSKEFVFAIDEAQSTFEWEWSDIYAQDANNNYLNSAFKDIYDKAGFRGTETSFDKVLKDQTGFSGSAVVIPDKFPIPREIKNIGNGVFDSARIEGQIIWPIEIENFDTARLNTGLFANAEIVDITKLELPKNITIIPKRMFYNVTLTPNTKFDDSLFTNRRIVEIGQEAFADAYFNDLSKDINAQNITAGVTRTKGEYVVDFQVPSTVTKIGDGAFSGAEIQTNFSFLNTSNQSWGNRLFEFSSISTGFVIPINTNNVISLAANTTLDSIFNLASNIDGTDKWSGWETSTNNQSFGPVWGAKSVEFNFLAVNTTITGWDGTKHNMSNTNTTIMNQLKRNRNSNNEVSVSIDTQTWTANDYKIYSIVFDDPNNTSLDANKDIKFHLKYNDGKHDLGDQEFTISFLGGITWNELTSSELAIYTTAGIAKGATSINNGAKFAGVTLPNNFPVPAEITQIGNEVFKNSIVEGKIIWPFNIGVNANDFGTDVFRGATIRNVSLFAFPSKMTVIRNGFMRETILTGTMNTNWIPNTVTTIESNAFWDSGKSNTYGWVLTLPASVKTIQNNAFYNVLLDGANFKLPDGVTLYQGAFGSDITDGSIRPGFVIPATAKANGSTAWTDIFSGNNNSRWTNGGPQPGSAKYVGIGWNELTPAQLAIYTASGIAKGATHIPTEAFKYKTLPDGFPIPEEITSVGDYAFKLATIEGAIIWPNNLWSNLNPANHTGASYKSGDGAGKSMFDQATIKDIGLFKLPKKMNVIPFGFMGSVKVTGSMDSNWIPNTVTAIGHTAFADFGISNSYGIDLNIPSSVTTIGSLAFWSVHINRMTLPDNIELGFKTFGLNQPASASRIKAGFTIPQTARLGYASEFTGGVANWEEVFNGWSATNVGNSTGWSTGTPQPGAVKQ